MPVTRVLEREAEVVFHRYYDPATGQFVSVDPLIDRTGTPYAFTAGDPVNGSDPVGLCNAQGNGNAWDLFNPWSSNNPIRCATQKDPNHVRNTLEVTGTVAAFVPGYGTLVSVGLQAIALKVDAVCYPSRVSGDSLALGLTVVSGGFARWAKSLSEADNAGQALKSGARIKTISRTPNSGLESSAASATGVAAGGLGNAANSLGSAGGGGGCCG